ncbi:MAG: polysaccharide deacetylase family protein [Actinobacteria bacterium]|nr:polysaccharide deacetylase family protein [Actinomycetota bacterium]
MKLPILMYHYVRPNSERMSERHNVLDFDLFGKQLDVMASKYEFILSNDLLNLDDDGSALKNKIWLTFDDGYRDCIDYVLPSLLKRKATGTFYIPTQAIFERKLLDVNKIHILLSGLVTPKEIVKLADQYFSEAGLEEILNITFNDLFAKFGVANLWNDRETEFIKKLFQKIIPTDIRKKYLASVFDQLVERSESSWVDELYLSPDDVQILVENGMEIGSHGHSHEWLAEMRIDDQRDELTKSFSHLDSAINDGKARSMCCPFGSYNDDTLTLLRNLNVKTGVLNRIETYARFEPGATDLLELDRIDIMFFDKFINGEFD